MSNRQPARRASRCRPEQYLPGGMLGTTFYEPSDQGFEARVAAKLVDLRARDAEESVEKRVMRYGD